MKQELHVSHHKANIELHTKNDEPRERNVGGQYNYGGVLEDAVIVLNFLPHIAVDAEANNDQG